MNDGTPLIHMYVYPSFHQFAGIWVSGPLHCPPSCRSSREFSFSEQRPRCTSMALPSGWTASREAPPMLCRRIFLCQWCFGWSLPVSSRYGFKLYNCYLINIQLIFNKYLINNFYLGYKRNGVLNDGLDWFNYRP